MTKESSSTERVESKYDRWGGGGALFPNMEVVNDFNAV